MDKRVLAESTLDFLRSHGQLSRDAVEDTRAQGQTGLEELNAAIGRFDAARPGDAWDDDIVDKALKLYDDLHTALVESSTYLQHLPTQHQQRSGSSSRTTLRRAESTLRVRPSEAETAPAMEVAAVEVAAGAGEAWDERPPATAARAPLGLRVSSRSRAWTWWSRRPSASLAAAAAGVVVVAAAAVADAELLLLRRRMQREAEERARRDYLENLVEDPQERHGRAGGSAPCATSRASSPRAARRRGRWSM